MNRIIMIIAILWALGWVGYAAAPEENPGLSSFLAPVHIPKTHYSYNVVVDSLHKSIGGSGEIRIHYEKGPDLSVLALEAKGPVTVSYGKKTLDCLAVVHGVHFFQSPDRLRAGGEMALTVRFTVPGVVFSDNGCFQMQGWLPRLWWDGLAHHASYQVKIAAPADIVVAASGRLNPSTGAYESSAVRSHALFLGVGLQKKEIRAHGVDIVMIHTAAGAPCAEYCLNVAADAVGFYKNWLGFYPHDFLYILPGGSGVWGGYPVATGMAAIHGAEKFATAPPYHWTFITAHEIGHQYWGEWVMDSDNPDWLWIGMGIYADREYTWARGFRRARGKDFLSDYSAGRSKGLDTTLDLPPDQAAALQFNHNSIVKHGKGFSAISALEVTLGRELFLRIYKTALEEFGGRRIGYRDFQALCERESGRSLQWFFDQWVRSNRYLHVQIISRDCRKEGSRYRTRLVMEHLGSLAMPAPVCAVFSDGTRQTQLTNRFQRICALEFVSATPLIDEIIDPLDQLPLLESCPSMTTEEIKKAVKALPWNGDGRDAVPLALAAEANNFEDRELWFKLGIALVDGRENLLADKAFKKVIDRNVSDHYHTASLVWLGHLEDLAGRRLAAIEWYKRALAHPAGLAMQHSQFNIILEKSWVEKRLREPFSW